MDYEDLLTELQAFADESYREFHSKLLKDPTINVIGVRVPTLRKLAKQHKNEFAEWLSFPDEYYEVTFLKCLVLGQQKYDVFAEYFPKILPHIDNWATCDCFDAPCIKKNREDFLARLKELRFSQHEFTSRYALVQLLKYYCEEQYLPFIFESVEGCDHTKYYVMMAAAWLMAEVLVRHYDAGVSMLKRGTMPAITHNKAIQKARESYRLTAEQKDYLKQLKR